MKLTVAAGFLGPLLALAWPAPHALAAGSPDVLEGRLTRITASFIQVDHERTYQFNPALVQCFDFRGDALPCETLVGIGYVDRARVTVRGSDVRRIEVVELQQ
jgi:hypothetical protein